MWKGHKMFSETSTLDLNVSSGCLRQKINMPKRSSEARKRIRRYKKKNRVNINSLCHLCFHGSSSGGDLRIAPAYRSIPSGSVFVDTHRICSALLRPPNRKVLLRYQLDPPTTSLSRCPTEEHRSTSNSGWFRSSIDPHGAMTTDSTKRIGNLDT
uniref:Ovule protein n=1 Tax=Steinernema glaseri TaxID=37863 RepID=A0A1I8A1M7_9BILA